MIIKHHAVPVFYTSEGSGNPLVLLHGFLETSKIWQPFLKELAVKRQVICIDLPGHGKTGNFEEIHSMELMAEVVNAVLEHLNIAQACFAGHSMGGYVSLAFAQKYPAKISGIILINSTPEADSEERKILREKSVALVKKNKQGFIKTAFKELVAPGTKDIYKKEIDELIKEALKISEQGIIAALLGMKIRTDRINLLRNLTVYKFMISGEDDVLLPPFVAKNVAFSSRTEILMLKGGHLLYIESYWEIRNFLHFID